MSSAAEHPVAPLDGRRDRPAPTARRLLAGSAWGAYLCVAGIVAGLYMVAHDSPFHSPPVFNALGISAVVAILVSMRTHRVARLPWALIAGGLAAFVLGDILAYNYERFFGSQLQSPSIADAFYLATYPLLIAGLVLLLRRRTPAHDRAALIDALIVSTSAGALFWALLIAPYAHNATLSLGTKLTSIAYPIMDLAVGACVARLALGPGRRPLSFVLLTVGVVALLITDMFYGWALLHGGYETGGRLDGGWIAFYVLIGAAALHRSAPALVDPVPDTQFRLTRHRLVGLALSALVAPAILAVQGFRDGVEDVPLLATCSAAVFIMVVLRLLDLGKRHEAALLRATVLAAAGAGLVEAHTTAEVEQVATSACRKMLKPGAQVTLVRDTDVAAVAAAAGPSMLVLPLQGRRTAHGALLVGDRGHHDADTVDGLRALANEVALALDSVELAESLLMQRTEARFQSLVQHSSDAILVIGSGGQIDFASPSTRRVLGDAPGELLGRSFLELVSPKDRGRISAALSGQAPSAASQTIEFELESKKGTLEVEATSTNLLDDENVGGIVVNIRDVSDRKTFERRLSYQAFHDEITGLANRALFRDRVEHSLERVRRGASLAVLFVDLDDFKTVNDTLGHQAGDRLIRLIAARIADCARAVDTPARLGGDEFAVLLEDVDLAEATHVAERLLETVALPVELDGEELMITASIGIAGAGAHSTVSVDTLLRDADVAMYAAKAAGKGTCQSFANEMHDAVLERLELKRELLVALERGEFELFYQPIVDLRSGENVSLEALLRWNHPRRGFVPPEQFISLAEETGAIVPIGIWALGQACADAAELVARVGDGAPSVAVNISALQLQRPEFVRTVCEILEATGLPTSQLVLEITETAMMEDLDLTLARLGELSAHGIGLAIDDFGTGYSSLNYIRKFPISILKIDRAFIADMKGPGEVASLARTIIDLTKTLDITAVAEGIERPEQLDQLRAIGCNLGQGYLFMRPAPIGEVEKALLDRSASREAMPVSA